MVDLPDIPNPLDKLKGLLPDLLGKLFDEVIKFLWKPLRPWFQDVFKTIEETAKGVTATKEMTVGLASKLNRFLSNLPDYVAGAIVDGFDYWIDPVIDLIEKAIDKAWDEIDES